MNKIICEDCKKYPQNSPLYDQNPEMKEIGIIQVLSQGTTQIFYQCPNCKSIKIQ